MLWRMAHRSLCGQKGIDARPFTPWPMQGGGRPSRAKYVVSPRRCTVICPGFADTAGSNPPPLVVRSAWFAASATWRRDPDKDRFSSHPLTHHAHQQSLQGSRERPERFVRSQVRIRFRERPGRVPAVGTVPPGMFLRRLPHPPSRAALLGPAVSRLGDDAATAYTVPDHFLASCVLPHGARGAGVCAWTRATRG
jgi:hypothetical protein